ncbi:MAG: GTP-binding protein EngA [Myxococcaceae bacterium]|nr:GTP-binding protein EngA [Myxococcaceae bacterium]
MSYEDDKDLERADDSDPSEAETAPDDDELEGEELEADDDDQLDDEELDDDDSDADEEQTDAALAASDEDTRPRRRRRKERPAGARTPRPLVAIVGRPNVGKSTLFNRLARANIAAVEDRPGVTRDRHYVDAEALGKEYVLIDTGGFDPDSDDPMQEGIARQVKLALEEADVVLCVMDASVELVSADREAVKLLRRANKPVLFLANKCDSEKRIAEAVSLYELGIDHFYPISALHSRGIGDLEEALSAALPPPKEVEESGYETAPHIAIIGRPNAGKSSLVNELLGEERQLVDARAGTTVDSIDTLLEKRGKRYVLIDTAGIRRKSRKKESVEQLGILQAVRAIERCDLVIMMIDAAEGVAEQDAKIAGIAADRGRAMIVVLNKSDLLTRDQLDKAIERTSEVLNFAAFAPIMTLSALTGRGTTKLLDKVDLAMESFRKRVTTGELNRFFEQVLEHHPPPPQGGRSVRLYYVSQAQVEPPTFIAMTNHPDDVHFSYKRYVANQIRKRFDFVGTPVRVMYRKKKNRRPNKAGSQAPEREKGR